MSGSIFKEVSLTPFVFEKDFSLSSHIRFAKLISILESLVDSGIIIAPSSNWRENVLQFVEQYDDEERDELASLLKQIDSREHLLFFPISTRLGNENDWISQIEKLDQKREFDFVAATRDAGIVSALENIRKEKYKNTGAQVEKQTAGYMRKMLTPVLAYADIAKVIDPYFKLTEIDGKPTKRYLDVLHIICEQLGSTHGKRVPAIIEIHTSVKAMLNNAQPREFVWSAIKGWQRILQDFEKKYGHSITIIVWEEIKRKEEWHERWLITNQCGIFIGKGSDISNWTESTWGLLNWDELPGISNRFNKNRQVYNYIGEVGANSFVKNTNPTNTSVYMTEGEKKANETKAKSNADEVERLRREKLKNPKKLRRTLVPKDQRKTK